MRNEARAAAVVAALDRLDQLPHDNERDENVIFELRANLNRRAARYQERLALLDTSEDGEVPASPSYTAAVTARREVIDAQREELLRWRDAGHLPDASLRTLQHELDLEEHTLPRP